MGIKHKFDQIPPLVDASQGRAFLLDGVFTFLAPNKANENNESENDEMDTKNAFLRTIPVEDESSIEPSIAGMNLNDEHEMADAADKEKKNGEGQVGENEDSWEQISED